MFVLDACCSSLAFVCCTEAVAEGKEPVETDEKQPEPPKPEPLQAVVAQEPSPTENDSNQPQSGGVGVKEQAESSNSTIKEDDPCSPPSPGKYTSTDQSHYSLSQAHVFTPLALPLKCC